MIGALLGHIAMGYTLSLMSMMGIVALSSVVVNDSLVMISTINENRRYGRSALDSDTTAAAAE